MIGLRLFIPWLPRGVMDMEYLDSVTVDPIKNLVWIAAERHDVNARAMGGAARAFRPVRDMCDDASDAPLDGWCNGWIMDD